MADDADGGPNDPGAADSGPAMQSDRCFPDKDDDGFPVKGESVEIGSGVDAPPGCPQGFATVLSFGDGMLWDCDDAEALVYPGAIEVCNGVDDDCDGETDEGLSQGCMDNCGNQGDKKCVDGQWTQCSVSGKECCEGERKDTIPCPPFDFVFLTDNSGSMASSDTYDIRYAAIEVFIDKMDNDIGLIMGFNHGVHVYGHFTDDASLLKAFMNQAKSAGPDGGTDIDGALYQAYSMFLQPGTKDVVILLTDGQDNDGYNPAVLKKAAEDVGIRLYILGLGGGVNQNVLVQTATSDGGYSFAAQPDEILSIYDDIFAITNYEHWLECNDKGEWVEKWGNCGE